jgi:DNA-binding MarR family transcriptional regulator
MDARRDLFFTHQALVILFSLTNKLQMQGDRYLKDLSIRQVLAVAAIIHLPDGETTINNIARKLGTSKQNAKQILTVMEKKDYLTIVPSKRDKRAVNVTITAEGERAFRACSERTDEFLADIFHEFTTEDVELLWALLRKLYRFDGSEQEEGSFEESVSAHQHHHTGEADADPLEHHQGYLKRRIDDQA